MKKYLSLFIIIALLLTTVTACSPKNQKFTEYSFDYFDTVTTIIGFEKSEETFKQNCENIKTWLSEYHKLYDIYTSYDGVTNLCTLNNSQGKTVAVDQKIIDLLLFSKELHSKNGKFNVAMGSVLSIWHDYRTYGLNNPDKATLPDEALLKEAKKHTDFNKVVINQEAKTVLISDPELTLDVGAIAKGYAAEQVAKMMLENGINGYLLNLGGNIKVVGDRIDGEKWKAGIENPDKSSDKAYAQTLALDSNMSLVTSGSYQRFYTVNDKNYNHIIDSQTLYPAEYFASVSVLCENSALADGLSTLLFCLPFESGKEIVEQTEGVYAMWITTDGEKLYSNGFKDFTYE